MREKKRCLARASTAHYYCCTKIPIWILYYFPFLNKNTHTEMLKLGGRLGGGRKPLLTLSFKGHIMGSATMVVLLRRHERFSFLECLLKTSKKQKIIFIGVFAPQEQSQWSLGAG